MRSQRFEYVADHVDQGLMHSDAATCVQQQANKRAKDGWQLVSTQMVQGRSSGNAQFVLVFKRPA